MATELEQGQAEELEENAIEVLPEYPEEVIEEAMTRLQAQSLMSEEGGELSKDTFNPSTQFNDKTHAEWMGNLLANKESDTMKNLSVQPPKPSKMMFLMLILMGFLIGIVVAAWFMGSFGGGGTTNTTHPLTTFVPTPPSGSSSPLINVPLRILRLVGI
jgi:hypothetical protein